MALNSINFGSTYSRNIQNDYLNRKDNEAVVNEVASKQTAVTPKEDGQVIAKEDAVKAPAHSNPNDFTFDFSKGNNFNLVAATSKVNDVDINRAVSDMKKEDVLNQYKFFVGSANLGTDADGTVRIVNK